MDGDSGMTELEGSGTVDGDGLLERLKKIF